MSKRASAFVAATAALSIAVPAAANPPDSAFATSADRSFAQPAVFTGATYRMRLDGRTGRPKGEFKVKLAPSIYDSSPAQHRFGSGLEIGRGEGGKMAISIAGQNAEIMDKRQNLNTGETVLILLAVVALIGTVVVLSALEAGVD